MICAADAIQSSDSHKEAEMTTGTSNLVYPPATPEKSEHLSNLRPYDSSSMRRAMPSMVELPNDKNQDVLTDWNIIFERLDEYLPPDWSYALLQERVCFINASHKFATWDDPRIKLHPWNQQRSPKVLAQQESLINHSNSPLPAKWKFAANGEGRFFFWQSDFVHPVTQWADPRSSGDESRLPHARSSQLINFKFAVSPSHRKEITRKFPSDTDGQETQDASQGLKQNPSSVPVGIQYPWRNTRKRSTSSIEIKLKGKQKTKDTNLNDPASDDDSVQGLTPSERPLSISSYLSNDGFQASRFMARLEAQPEAQALKILLNKDGRWDSHFERIVNNGNFDSDLLREAMQRPLQFDSGSYSTHESRPGSLAGREDHIEDNNQEPLGPLDTFARTVQAQLASEGVEEDLEDIRDIIDLHIDEPNEVLPDLRLFYVVKQMNASKVSDRYLDDERIRQDLELPNMTPQRVARLHIAAGLKAERLELRRAARAETRDAVEGAARDAALDDDEDGSDDEDNGVSLA